MSTLNRPRQAAEWRQALDSLPNDTARIPAFWFAHGSPGLVTDPKEHARANRLGRDALVGGRQPAFLKDFARTLLEKYHPKAIVIFSAHWDTKHEIMVSDWSPRNPILYDYYGFPKHMYEHDFHSHGDAELSRKVVGLLTDAGLKARLLGRTETRGLDGRTMESGYGIDHGVMMPFIVMFDDSGPDGFEIPVVQVSICGGAYAPKDEQALGAAVRSLRDEGILILSGGLSYHNLSNPNGFAEENHGPEEIAWDNAVLESVEKPKTVQERHKATADLEKHPGFRVAHPRADHFAPFWVAEGAGSEDVEGNGAKVLSALYGANTIAFF